MKQRAFHISDHMLLRYLERVLGLKIEDFREQLHAKLEPYAKAGVASVEDAGMVFKFCYSDGLVSVSTCWPSGYVPAKQVPPKTVKDSREYMKSQARKRQGK